MDAPAIINALGPLVAGAAYEAAPSVDFATIYVPADRLVATCAALRETPSLRFNVLVEVTAADYFPRDPRFEVVYHLLSMPHRLRLRLKVRATETAGRADGAGRLAVAPAGWSAKCGTCSGSSSTVIPDLRRLLMPEDWEGHPQRKDYPGPDPQGGADLRAARGQRGRVQGEHGSGIAIKRHALHRWPNCAPKR